VTLEDFRLPGPPGRPLTFTFNARTYIGREGDTLASALLAHGVHFVARSFKYHRPRGFLAAGREEPNALVALGSGGRVDTNTQATCIELFAGLEARSINAWPSLRFDGGALLGRLGRFMPSGFYYKTFFWPSWHFFERHIRRAAGLGVAPTQVDPDRYDRPNRHCDVLVVGSGPAGLAAALERGRAGADVLLLEQEPEPGGTLRWDERPVDGVAASEWLGRILAELATLPNVTLLTRTVVVSHLDHNLLLAVQQAGEHGESGGQQLWHIRAGHVILATGAIERPLVFPDNDRPGIMLASAVRRYALQYQVAVGSRIVVATNNDDAYRTAQVLLAAGIQVAAIVDSRAHSDSVCQGVPIHRGAVITRTRGRQRVHQVQVRTLDGAQHWRIDCDAVAMSGGWNPTVQLFCQRGGKLRYDTEAVAFVPAECPPDVDIIGAAAGQGLVASSRTMPLWEVAPQLAPSAKQWVDFHNDVTVADIALAALENFQSVEHLKRYTTLGMAPDQGKTSNLNGLALLGERTGRAPGEVGTTTFRPPFVPLRFGVVGGRDRGALYHPSRRLPTDALQTGHGAQMADYGAWLRPAFYPAAGEDMAAAIHREVTAVRRAVGILDYSPLGKIQVVGAHAMTFLNQIVATNLATLKVGSARYSLTLTEGGIISDDGIVSRLGEDLYLLGTTSGAAERMYFLLEEWHQREAPSLSVRITNVTGHWGVLMLSGPKARELLGRCSLDFDPSAAAFPHMSVRQGHIEGIPVRASRVSFTGEVSFELAVPAGYAAALWRHFFAMGKDLGLAPIGIEALDVLRIEKGFIHVGGETDGSTVPDDVGYGAMCKNKKTDFIGRRTLALPALNGAERLQLIGLKPLDGTTPLAVGAQLAPSPQRPVTRLYGHVTSSVWSPTLAAPVALGMLAGGRQRGGERLFAWSAGAFRPVEVVDPRRYDPEGALLSG